MKDTQFTRRDFLAGSGLFLAGIVVGDGETPPKDLVKLPGIPPEARWGYLIDPSKCIGCGNCMRSCRKENNVPTEAPASEETVAAPAEEDESLRSLVDRYLFTPGADAKNTPHTNSHWRTWVERYLFVETEEGVKLRVDAPDGGEHGYPDVKEKVVKGHFIPKLCNHCADPSCVKVCPVSATYVSPEGVVLIDDTWCIGCGYCIQACPYNMRFMDHRFGRGVAAKCTWCYHRITKDLQPACVLTCPTGARAFGDLTNARDPVTRAFKNKQVYVLRPDTGNDPQVRYTQLSREVI